MKEKQTESFNLTVEMKRKSNYNLNLRKLRINKIPYAETTKQLYMKKLQTLRIICI